MPKIIGDKVYVHISAVPSLDGILRERIAEAVVAVPAERQHFNIVRVSKKANDVSVMYAPYFDTEDEPRLEWSLHIVAGQCSSVKPQSQINPAIYHGKHLFVNKDYAGFDVAAAAKRYDTWKNANVPEANDITRIGRLRYWQDIVLPLINFD